MTPRGLAGELTHEPNSDFRVGSREQPQFPGQAAKPLWLRAVTPPVVLGSITPRFPRCCPGSPGARGKAGEGWPGGLVSSQERVLGAAWTVVIPVLAAELDFPCRAQRGFEVRSREVPFGL